MTTTRESDLETIESIRRAHAVRIELGRSGRVAEALAAGDPIGGSTYVVKILDVAPGLGKVAGRRLLASLGTGAFATVNDLDDNARRAIIRECGDGGSTS